MISNFSLSKLSIYQSCCFIEGVSGSIDGSCSFSLVRLSGSNLTGGGAEGGNCGGGVRMPSSHDSKMLSDWNGVPIIKK